jgi:hypothetical protein
VNGSGTLLLRKESMKKPKIRCGKHGKSYTSILCRHLCGGTGLSYHAFKYPPDHPAVWQAWCLECHAVLEEEGGWTARSEKFADLKIVCTSCFKNAVRRNKRLPLAV